jgi:hypothetical protein
VCGASAIDKKICCVHLGLENAVNVDFLVAASYIRNMFGKGGVGCGFGVKGF